MGAERTLRRRAEARGTAKDMARDMGTAGLASGRLARRERKSWLDNAGKLRLETGRIAEMRIPAG